MSGEMTQAGDNPATTTATTTQPETVAPVTPAPAAEAAPDWRASLPEDLRAAPSLQKFQDPAALAKGYVEAEKLIGRKGVIVPGEGATEAEQQAFRKALGVPDAPDAYEIKVEAPEHIWNDAATALLREGAHKLGLTPPQAQGLAQWYASTLAAADDKAAEQADAALREAWGPAYERNTALASKAAQELLGEAAAAELKKAGLAHNVHMLKALARMGEAILPADGSAGMATGGASGGAKAELDRYFTPGTPENARYMTGDPRVAKYVTELRQRVAA